MMTLFSIWQSFQSLVNTSQNSYFRPQTDFAQAVNDISKDLWDTWTSQNEKSYQIRTYLSPFLKSKNIVTKPANSYYTVAKYPGDYGRLASAAVWSLNDAAIPCPNVDDGKCEGFETQSEVDEKFYENIVERQVDLIDEKRWKACLTHLTKKPTLLRPKMTQIDGGWNLAPRTASVLVLDYYIVPTDGEFKYTVVPGDPQTGAGDFIQYDPSSTPLQWNSVVLNYFLWKLALRYGIFIGNTFLAQFAEKQKAA